MSTTCAGGCLLVRLSCPRSPRSRTCRLPQPLKIRWYAYQIYWLARALSPTIEHRIPAELASGHHAEPAGFSPISKGPAYACPTWKNSLSSSSRRFQDDGIAYLLIQFVDIHGAPKVKLVPASTLRSVAEVGAGFAGGAVWGMGQGPHSHDLQARADLGSYTPLPYEPGVARFAADLYVDGEPHPLLSPRQSQSSARPGQRKGLSLQCRHRARVFPGGQERGRLDPRLGPAPGRRPGQAVLRLQGHFRCSRFSARRSTTAWAAWAGASISPTTKTPISSTRSTFDMPTP